jgi:hypothetical protein
MRPTLILPLFAAAALSCVPGNNPFRVIGVSKLDAMCAAPMMMSAAPVNGNLDASGSVTYILDLKIEADITVPMLQDTNGMELNTPSQSDFVIDSISSTYKLTDNTTHAVTPIKADTRPIYAVIQATSGGTGTADVVVNIIGEGAIKSIVTAVNDPSQVATLIVGVSLNGHLQSGQTMSTDVVNFPLTVTRSFVNGMSVDCPTQLANGANATAATGPCGSGGGQDGAAITCL